MIDTATILLGTMVEIDRDMESKRPTRAAKQASCTKLSWTKLPKHGAAIAGCYCYCTFLSV